MRSTCYGIHKFVYDGLQQSFSAVRCLLWCSGVFGVEDVSEDSARRVDVLTVWSLADNAPSLPLPPCLFSLSLYSQMCVTILLISNISDFQTPPVLTPSGILYLHFSVRPLEDTRVKLLTSLWSPPLPPVPPDPPLCRG